MNEIKTIPFETLYLESKKQTKEQLDSQLQALINIKRRQHKEQMDRLVAITGQFDPEAGSDGVEEYANEAYGAFDPDSIELPERVVKEVSSKTRELVHKDFCETYTISSKLDWLTHQFLAEVGSWTAVKDEEGKYSPLLTLRKNAATDREIGMVFFATGPRSNMFAKGPRNHPQYKSAFNPLTPLLLAAFKKYQNINYSSWSHEGLDKFVDEALYEAMVCVPPVLSQTDIITLINTALVDETGPRAGKPNNPATCAKLNRMATTAIGGLPRLAKFMVLQTWCAHPSNRNQYMILDPKLWDNIPAPVVETSILTEAKTTSKWSTEDMPW